MGELENKISTKALKVWRLSGFLYALIGIVIAVGLTIVNALFDWPKWLYIIYWGLALLEFVLLVFVLPSLRWKWWRYEVREHEIEIQKGLFVVTKTLFPMDRVQHVETKQGPIYRKYDLAAVHISTAATVHVIPALDSLEADHLRQKISILASVEEEDV
ncbi:PH domain-containing protein [Peribacillus tepidiphilus]|jgi:membrane protein YdbS with pleckstrin-like domain|uniref:PH domain-containing protein n=1 Tax=Peribacillus tepidiphilus TaxID=2652445 RepID=UPI0035B51E00